VLQNGVFRAVGSREQDEFFREGRFAIDGAAWPATGDEVTVRVYKVRGHAAHLDAVTLGDARLLRASVPGLAAQQAAAFTRKLAARDFDVTELPRAPLTLVFQRPSRLASLNVTARIEAERICETPFHFPLENGVRPLAPDSTFFSYRLGSARGRLVLDGSLDEVSDAQPFMRELAKAGTGHPSDDVLAWVRDDGERLYVAIDFTGDNTQDGGKDYAAVYVNTPGGVREYKVTAEDSRHGLAGFGYSKAVGYAHKLYEFSIALAELGAAPLASLQLAFATYGTCSPCLCPYGQNFDVGRNCCPPEQIGIDGYCCGTELAEDGSCLQARGAIYDIKSLEHSGIGEHVTDLNGNGTLSAAAVGYSSFGNSTSSATAWNVGIANAVNKRNALTSWQDFSSSVQNRAFGVNDEGYVVGWRMYDDGEATYARAFRTTPSSPPLPYSGDPDPSHYIQQNLQSYAPSLLEMELLPGSGVVGDTFAVAINNASPPQSAGATRAGYMVPVRWDDTLATLLPVLDPEGDAAALAINDQGVAAGYSTDIIIQQCGEETCEVPVEHPVIWDGNTLTDLGLQCPTCSARAVDINADGWVVGYTSIVGTTDPYAFIYIPSGAPAGLQNGMNVIGLGPTFAGGGSYFGTSGFFQTIGINDHGHVVGTVLDATDTPRAFLWLPEVAYQLEPGFYYLDDLISPISGGENDGLSSQIMRWSVDISNTGTILAYGRRRNSGAGDNEYYLALLPNGNRPPEHLPHVDDAFAPPVLDLDLTLEDSDPVNTFSGELIVREEPDLAIGRLKFERFYAGRLEERAVPDRTPLGPGWRHHYQWSLTLDDSVEPQRVVITSPESSRTELEQGEDLGWTPLGADGMGYQLVEVVEGFELVTPVPQRLLRFDEDGRLVGIENPEGYTQTLSYTGALLTGISDGFGNALTLTYDGDQLQSVSAGTRTVSFAYDAAGSPLRFVTDVLGHVTEYVYDGDLRMTAKVLPRGEAHVTQVYDDDGRVASQTDALDNVTSFIYDHDDIAYRTAIVDPLGNTRIHQYTGWARLLTTHDESGYETQYHYDDEGQRVGTGLGLRPEREYWSAPDSGRPEASIDVQGGYTEHLYESNAWGNVTRHDRVRTTYADGSYDAASYERQAGSTTITLSDRAGFTSTVTLDGVGQVVSSANPFGGITAYSYHGDGCLQSVTSPAGDTTELTHELDGSNLVTTLTHPDGAQLVLTYDAERKLVGRSLVPIGATGPAQTHAHTYDDNGNLESTLDPLGHTTLYSYDAMDRLTGLVDAAGHDHAIEYDERGLVSRVVDGSGVELLLGYDERGQLVTMTDAHGLSWTMAYDDRGRVVSRTAPESEPISYEYFDDAGQLLVTDPLGAMMTHTYDAMGRLVSLEDGEGALTCYSYDPRGLLTSATLPSVALTEGCAERTELAPELAVTAQYGWNDAGLLQSVIDPNEHEWTRTYDDSGRLESSIDPLLRSTSYAYDARDRLASVSHPNGDHEQISYDDYGRVAARLYTGSAQADETFEFSYDALGRILGVNDETFQYDANGVLTAANGFSFTSDGAGRLRTVTLAPGQVITYVYDSGRLVAVQDWLGGELTFAYDSRGRLQRITRPNGIATIYGHDELDRIVSIREMAEEQLADTTVTYAANGRVGEITRTQHPHALPAVASPPARTFDAASQIEGFDYDERGRPVSAAGRSYAWSAAGRLSSYTEAAHTVNLRYDAYGSLVERSQGATTTAYRHSYAHTLPCPMERNLDGAITHYVCTPAGELLYGIDAGSGARHYFHFDESGNTRLVSDDDAEVIASYAYFPFGEIAGGSVAPGLDNPFTFSGRFGVLQEGQSGLFHMRKRIYDSRTQRFLTRDPIGQQLEPRLVNPYQYAANDPISFVDPLGATPTRSTYEGSTADKVVTTVLNVNTNATYVLKEFPTAIANSLAREAELVRKFAPPSALKTERLADLWGKVDRIDRFAERADKLGTAGDVLGSALEAYKTGEKLNGIHAETLSCQDMALRTLDNQMSAVRQSVKDGSISPERGAELVREFSSQFDTALEQCESRSWIDTGIAALEGFKNTLAGITPAPVQHGLSAFESGVQKLGNSRNPFIFVKR
jgi:RHS repeat-associated protein